jgi:uncharacterized protein (TIGR02246 family)
MKRALFLLVLLTFQLANCYSQRNLDIRSDTPLLKEINSNKSANEKTFLEALLAHLTAIQNRDLDGYVKTISQKSDITMIFTDGSMMNNRDSIIAMHREWFTSKVWVFNYTIEETIIKENFAIALLAINYHDVDKQGNPIEANYLLSLTFENQDGVWRLIFDQNTRNPSKHSLKK